MKTSLTASRGNAVLISVAITGFLFLAAAGASKVIMGSLRDSPKIVESSEALYAAESALEAALYDAKFRGSGYTTDPGSTGGDEAYVALNNINSSRGDWQVNGQTEMERSRVGDASVYANTFFIPPRRVMNNTINAEDLANWRKVRMGEKVTFDLFVDTSPSKAPPLELGTGNQVTAPATTPTQTGFMGPNGIYSSNTKSILTDDVGNNNTDFDDVFIDLYLPTDELAENTDNPILLSWQFEGMIDRGFSNPPLVLKLISSGECGGISTSAGVICHNHFIEKVDNTNIPINLMAGLWVRLTNPKGILTAGDLNDATADPTVSEISLLEFLKREVSSFPTVLTNERMYFPRLTLQIGQPTKTIHDETISEAYIRVGFSSSASAANPQLFPLPDDKVIINATGASGVVKKGVQAEIHPQEGAPMFDYSVFQP